MHYYGEILGPKERVSEDDFPRPLPSLVCFVAPSTSWDLSGALIP